MDAKFLQADNEDSYQSELIRSLVLVQRTCQKVHFHVVALVYCICMYALALIQYRLYVIPPVCGSIIMSFRPSTIPCFRYSVITIQQIDSKRNVPLRVVNSLIKLNRTNFSRLLG